MANLNSLSRLGRTVVKYYGKTPLSRIAKSLGLNRYLRICYTLYFLASSKSHSLLSSRLLNFSVLMNMRAPVSEEGIIRDLLAVTRPSDTVLDIGANHGVYSLLLADTLTYGKVVAFEPHPENVAILSKGVRHSGLPIEIRESAVAASPGEFELVESDHHAGHRLNAEGKYEDESTVTVDIESLDDLVEQGEIPQPNVVKIDVEGVELDVLSGGRVTLGNPDCRVVVVEIHENISDYGGDASAVTSELESLGFRIERHYERGGTPLVLAVRD